MTFFVIGAGPGKGADLGGIEGADRYCQELAQRAGAGSKTWRAYLSTQAVSRKQRQRSASLRATSASTFSTSSHDVKLI